LILTGRSEAGPALRDKLDELEQLGAKVVYRSVDVSNEDSVDRLVEDIQRQHGGLNGIVHSAGVIQDNFILSKTKAEFSQVLAPKVSGLLHLDRATKAMNLDFFVLFSSVAGTRGNLGQVDYSTANSFLDAFARYRNALVSDGLRHGRTLSIAWPLWKHGGLGMDEATEVMVMESLGMVAMETSIGLDGFYRAFASDQSQVVIMHGLLKRIKEKFLFANKRVSQNLPKPVIDERHPVRDAGDLHARVQQSLLQTAARVLKLKAE